MACVELRGAAEEISKLLAPITDLSLPSVSSQRYLKVAVNISLTMQHILIRLH